MSGPPCDTHGPSVEVFIRIRYCCDHQSWEGAVNVDGRTAAGSTISLSSGRHTFGPFDSYTEVGQWLSSQQRVLKTIVHPDMMEKLC